MSPSSASCPRCPELPPPGAAFCPRCGTPCVPGDEGEGRATEERRVVTVVFCDMVGSTALSGRLDPEALRTVTLRYFALMRAPIEEHGGTVEKFIGDAVMAVFGVPVRHEDDARRALAAARGMVAALDGLNADLERDHGLRLAVRIGVNTGEVVAGTDPAARQALVSGEVVNIAARLEQHAGPGEVLVGPQTVRAAGPSAVTEPAGPLSLKGVGEPVPAHRLLALHEDDPERVRRFDTPFVGRDRELAELELLSRKLSDASRCWLLTVYGEAGLGKTRLLREWLRTSPAATVHGEGRCRPYGESGTLAPLADAVRQALHMTDLPTDLPTDTPTDTPTHTPAARDALALLHTGLLADGTPSPSADDTCLALVRVLSELAARRPVVLVLDDVQWASGPLLDMIDRLLDELDDAAVAVVCAARPELLETRPGWGSGRMRSTALSLGGLGPAEAAELAGGLVEVTAHRPGVVEQALRRAEGNPLYLEQLIAMEAEAVPDELPPTVHALLGARIDALPAQERTLLQLAAVLGREFRRAELAGLAAPEPGALGEETAGLLRRLVRRRLIESGGRPLDEEAVLRFGSALVQQTAYRGMAKRVRARRHAHAADILARYAAGDTAGDAAVGTHLARAHRFLTELGLRGPDTDVLRMRAADVLTRAGAAALARSDLPWADDLLTQGLELAAPGEPAHLAAARRLGEVKAARGEPERGRDLLAGALEQAEAAGDRLAAAHARLALTAIDPGRGEVADAAEAALPLFTEAGDDQGIARACVRAAQGRQRRGRHAEADALLRRALAHAALADAEPERALALGAVGVSLWRGPMPVDEAVDRCRALLAEHGPGRPTVQATLGCPLAVLLALRGEPGAARERLAEAGRAARELGYAEAALFVPLFAAAIEAQAGRPDRVPGLLDEAARAAHRLGAAGARPGIARDRARALLDLAPAAPAVGAEAVAACEAALALPDPRTAGLPPAESADADGLRARAHALAGDGVRALTLADRALAAARATDSPVVRATAALDQALVLTALGRPDPAARAAAVALEHFTAKGHRPGAARAAALTAPAPEVTP